MADTKKIVFLIISAVILAVLLYFLFTQIYLSKSQLLIFLISIAVFADCIFFVKTFLQITSNYRDN